MSFQQVLDAQFPGSIPMQAYFSRLQTALYRHSFTRERALLVVGLCRDELTSHVTQELIAAWGNGFVMNGLAGMLSGGVTSLTAAARHAPMRDGRERLILVAQTHVAIGMHGEIGVCSRPGQMGVSTACGALTALSASIASGEPPNTADPDDAEYHWLWRRLAPRFEAGVAPDLVDLTKVAHEAIVGDAGRMLERAIDTEVADYAVATGVQIHGPGGRDYIWPGVLYVVAGGEHETVRFDA